MHDYDYRAFRLICVESGKGVFGAGFLDQRVDFKGYLEPSSSLKCCLKTIVIEHLYRRKIFHNVQLSVLWS